VCRAKIHSVSTLAKEHLCLEGHDCVGALQFLAPDVQPTPAGTVDAVPISGREIATILDNLATAPLGITEDESFRISIASAQEKTALLRWDGRWCKPRGTTATTHIFKPSIGKLPNGVDLTSSVENEYLCLKILNALRLPTAIAEMETFGDRRVLIVERFDRLWTGNQRLLRLPQEDSCQALSVPPTLKHQSDGGPGITAILKMLRGSDEPLSDQRSFLKAKIAFWLIGATDGHAKNFSLFLSPGGRFQMTPLYDVISAQPSVDSKQVLWKQFRLAMGFGIKPHYQIRQIAPRHFFETANQAGIGQQVIESVIDELLEGAAFAADSVVSSLPRDFPGQIASSIVKGIKRRLQVLGNRAPAK
jgi:serine/threonine-protein kinase HipA